MIVYAPLPAYIRDVIFITNVSKSFASERALDHVHLTVPVGEVHALIGLSGSGKSTLLRILMGVIPPDSGEIRVGKLRLGAVAHSQWVQNIGYVPQESGLFPHLTASENIRLRAETLSWNSDRMRARMEALLELTALDPALLERYPHELSGGQKQRVALMRAAFLDPQVMVLDEPMGALDPMIRSELQAELKSAFARLNKTVLLVTHDLAEAAYLAKSVSLMNEGRIVQQGSLAELVRQPADDYVRRFITAQRSLHFEVEE
ncbi:MAG: ATP-binding cassette domain-containing protein [Bdellovibrionales bacterium]